MKKIITLTGHMNCGKVKLAYDLAKNSEVSYIRPFTDKPTPFGEIQEEYGDFNYVSRDHLDKLIDEENLLSMTTIKGIRYCFFECQLQDGYNVLIVDDYGVVDIQNQWNGGLYTIKVWAEGQKESNRVGTFLYNTDFDEIFHYGVDDVSELEWRISYDFD